MAWEPLYADADDLAAYKGVNDVADEAEMGLACEAASRIIDQVCGRQFGQVDAAEARHYDVEWDRELGLYVADIDDLMTTDNLVVNAGTEALGTDEYVLLPRNAAATGDPWTEIGAETAEEPTVGRGPRELIITAEWGWTAVPDAIKQATLLQAARLLKRKDAPFGVAGSPQLGTDLRLLEHADVDAKVITMVAKFRRNRLFA